MSVKHKKILELHRQKMSAMQIAVELNYSYKYVYQVLARLGLKPGPFTGPRPKKKKTDLASMDEINWRNAAKDSGFF